jgi:hypothetical protein
VVFGSGFAAAKHHKPQSSFVDEHFAHFCGMHSLLLGRLTFPWVQGENLDVSLGVDPGFSFICL